MSPDVARHVSPALVPMRKFRLEAIRASRRSRRPRLCNSMKECDGVDFGDADTDVSVTGTAVPVTKAGSERRGRIEALRAKRAARVGAVEPSAAEDDTSGLGWAAAAAVVAAGGAVDAQRAERQLRMEALKANAAARERRRGDPSHLNGQTASDDGADNPGMCATPINHNSNRPSGGQHIVEEATAEEGRNTCEGHQPPAVGTAGEQRRALLEGLREKRRANGGVDVDRACNPSGGDHRTEEAAAEAGSDVCEGWRPAAAGTAGEQRRVLLVALREKRQARGGCTGAMEMPPGARAPAALHVDSMPEDDERAKASAADEQLAAFDALMARRALRADPMLSLGLQADASAVAPPLEGESPGFHAASASMSGAGAAVLDAASARTREIVNGGAGCDEVDKQHVLSRAATAQEVIRATEWDAENAAVSTPTSSRLVAAEPQAEEQVELSFHAAEKEVESAQGSVACAVATPCPGAAPSCVDSHSEQRAPSKSRCGALHGTAPCAGGGAGAATCVLSKVNALPIRVEGLPLGGHDGSFGSSAAEGRRAAAERLRLKPEQAVVDEDAATYALLMPTAPTARSADDDTASSRRTRLAEIPSRRGVEPREASPAIDFVRPPNASSASVVPSVADELDTAHRLRRISELRRARGAALAEPIKPVAQAEQSSPPTPSAPATLAPVRVGREHRGSAPTLDEDDPDADRGVVADETFVSVTAPTDASTGAELCIPTETSAFRRSGATREASSPAPCGTQPASAVETPCALTQTPRPVELKAPAAAVEEMKQRWERFQRLNGATSHAQHLAVEADDAHADATWEVKAKWQRVRGFDCLRRDEFSAEMQLAVAPLDVRFDFKATSVATGEGGRGGSGVRAPNQLSLPSSPKPASTALPPIGRRLPGLGASPAALRSESGGAFSGGGGSGGGGSSDVPAACAQQ